METFYHVFSLLDKTPLATNFFVFKRFSQFAHAFGEVTLLVKLSLNIVEPFRANLNKTVSFVFNNSVVSEQITFHRA